MQPASSSTAARALLRGLEPLPLSPSSGSQQVGNDTDPVTEKCWHGFLVEKLDDNIRFLREIVADSRGKVVGTNHLAEDIRLHFPDLRKRHLVKISLSYGLHVMEDMIDLSQAMGLINGKFIEKGHFGKTTTGELANISTPFPRAGSETPGTSEADCRSRRDFVASKLDHFYVRKGFGEGGPQMRQCLINLQKSGIPAKDIWCLYFSQDESTNSDGPDFVPETQALILIADNCTFQRLFNALEAKIRGANGNKYDRRIHNLSSTAQEFFGLVQKWIKTPAIIVDAFHNRVVSVDELMRHAESIPQIIGLRGMQHILPILSLQEAPVTDIDTSDFESEIADDEDASRAVRTCQSIAHKIRLVDIIVKSDMDEKVKEILCGSIARERNFNLALRQCSYVEANEVFDYLLANRNELGINIHSTSTTGKTALDYARKAGNTHAMESLAALPAQLPAPAQFPASSETGTMA